MRGYRYGTVSGVWSNYLLLLKLLICAGGVEGRGLPSSEKLANPRGREPP